MYKFRDTKDYVQTHVRYFGLTEYDFYVENEYRQLSKAEKTDYYIQLALAMSNCV